MRIGDLEAIKICNNSRGYASQYFILLVFIYAVPFNSSTFHNFSSALNFSKEPDCLYC